MQILVAEDQRVEAELLSRNLKRDNYEVTVVHNGLDALNLLETRTDIALVISDIMMPKLDGLGLVGKMNENPRLKSIPVLILTSLADTSSVVQAARLGCKHYLLKPFERDVMLRKVLDAIAERKRVIASKSEIMEQYGLNQESYERAAASFSGEICRLRGQLEEALRSRQGSVASDRLAILSDSARLFGAERFLIYLNKIVFNNEKGIIHSAAYPMILSELKLLFESLQKNSSEAAG
jgi:CheY-like chemotaxis protein